MGYQILHVTLSSGPSVRGVNYSPKVELIAKDNKFYIGLFSEYFEIFLLELMATNFIPSSGSYVLHKFPSISQWSDTGPSWPSCSTMLSTQSDNCIVHIGISGKGLSCNWLLNVPLPILPEAKCRKIERQRETSKVRIDWVTSLLSCPDSSVASVQNRE